jgi:hypothetical protein
LGRDDRVPWENGAWDGPNSGLFKSTDGGTTWRQLTAGLPTPAEGLSRIGFCIAPSDPSRLYATVAAGPSNGGIYRSDDAGESWKKLNSDQRFWGRGDDFAEVKADPKNKDIVYTADVVVWKSTDGGMSWNAFKGAPGGDDYHRLWINPDHPEVMLVACDQGAIVTVNGGHTFSSWYNQPTAQFYHVVTDNAYPYNVYGGQQESGSIGIASRGNDGEITFREWHPVGVEEYGYVAPDPWTPILFMAVRSPAMTSVRARYKTSPLKRSKAVNTGFFVPRRPVLPDRPAYALFCRECLVQNQQWRPLLAGDQPRSQP